MAKATTTIQFQGKSVELWYGTTAAKKLEKLIGRSLLTLDEEGAKDLGLNFLTQIIQAGFAHLREDLQPDPVAIDTMIDELDSETEAAPSSSHETEAEALANVLDRKADGQTPKVVPPAKENGKWVVVDEPPPPKGDTFVGLNGKVLAAFTAGMPGGKKKRVKPGAPPNPTR